MLGDEDGADLATPGEPQHLCGAGPLIVGAGGRLLKDGHDLVPTTLGERPQVPFLPLARLVVGDRTFAEFQASQLKREEVVAIAMSVLGRHKEEHVAQGCSRLHS